ncbi:site-specific DNA-methyltransferase [Geobacter sp.]|uniref:site-specific DNA-methyltransferase n=1 Tax=Geobacter sp. TaxID=46610 RepID=UPI0027B8DF38|nr:site-specific DNA-methyltransferase [Geobacter sp.]
MTSKYDRYSKEELIKIIEERDRKPRLGLVWERDEIDHDRSLNQDFVALDLLPEFSRGDGPWHNLLIEGDNFDALRYLRMTHAGRVKCIYIDPPYNTGNKDFIYNDRFVDKDDAWKHSKWLEYLYRRLLLARDLLAEDGVLLVSINDENRAKLELLLDQALPGMRLGSFVWRTRQGSNADQGCFLSVDHEHVLVYGNVGFQFVGYGKSYEMYSNPDNDPRGDWRTGDLTLGFSYQERPNLYYPLKDPKTDIYYPASPIGVWRYATKERVKPGQRLQAKTMEEFIELGQILFPQEQRVVVWNSREELLAAIENGEVPKTGKVLMLRPDLPDLDFWIGKKVGFGRPAFKRYKADLRNLNQPLSSWVVPSAEQKRYEAENSFVSGTNQEGAKAVSAIFGTKSFNYAKPPSLIKELVRQSTGANDLVMDFFAGSGTTAQAVLELNREDGGERRFIMVSATEATADDPDKNICRDVCAERIRRVMAGYGGREGTGGDFAYLRVQRMPQEDVLTEIDHSQVWTALQLIHRQSFMPFTHGMALQEAISPDGGLVYATAISNDTADRIAALAAETAHLTVYTWQPGLLRERLASQGITVEQIPQFLVNRFGGVA